MKGIRRRAALFIMLSAAAALSWAAGLSVRQERQRLLQAVLSERGERQIEVIAHRGGAAYAPENTLAALEQAVAAGADMAEIDLRMTKDGVLIALHDETLKRTTGLDRLVWELDSEIVRELDAGKWFSSDFEGEQIPTLNELLETARGRIRLVLEIKKSQSGQALLEQVVEQIRAKGMEEECVLASNSLDLLRWGKELAPELENVYIGEAAGPKLWGLSYVNGYSICLSNLTVQDVKEAHRVGRALYVWTVNERLEMEGALTMGVDGLVTDDPALALELLNRGVVKTNDRAG